MASNRLLNVGSCKRRRVSADKTVAKRILTVTLAQLMRSVAS